MNNDDVQITTLSARLMAEELLRATHRLWRVRRADYADPLDYYAALAQQVDVAGYWFSVLTHDAERSGWLLRAAIARTADAVELTGQLIDLWRQYTLMVQAQAAADAAGAEAL